MNFGQNIDCISEKIEGTIHLLDSTRFFSFRNRERFNRIITELEHFLARDKQQNSEKSWHIARRVIQLYSVKTKIEEVRVRIVKYCAIPFFTKKIMTKINPLLENKIKRDEFSLLSKKKNT